MPELAIDRAIAAVRQEIADWNVAEKHAKYGALRDENDAQRANLRAALEILEAAKAWGIKYNTSAPTPLSWIKSCQILDRVIRSEP